MTPPALLDLCGTLIAVFEGCRLEAYQDSGGVWTIGMGHTKGVKPGMTITRDQALSFFAEDQADLLALVAGKRPLEGAAYISFGFNCGASTLRQLLAGAIAFGDRVRDRHGNVLAGLVARRRLEEQLARYDRAPDASEFQQV
jgi:lysozyme